MCCIIGQSGVITSAYIEAIIRIVICSIVRQITVITGRQVEAAGGIVGYAVGYGMIATCADVETIGRVVMDSVVGENATVGIVSKQPSLVL